MPVSDAVAPNANSNIARPWLTAVSTAASAAAPLISRPEFLANDSGLFPFRFCAVHPKAAGD
jgi:hypothetical protein